MSASLQRAGVRCSTALASIMWLGATGSLCADDCAADFDGSNAIDGGDLAVLLGEWGRPGSADLDGNNVVDGVDLSILLGSWGACFHETLEGLFLEPTAAELDAVRGDWATRDLEVVNWTVLGSGIFAGLDVEVVSHDLDGNTHYGFIRYPEAYDPAGSHPVLVLSHGGQAGVGLGILGQASNGCMREFVVVVPSFRGEVLRTEGLGLGDLLSEGEKSEFDGDLDDTIALLNGTLEHVGGADAGRIAAFGGSRGGCVTHLLSVRDERIQSGVAFFGATNHMLEEIRDSIIEILEEDGQSTNPVVSTALLSAVMPWLDGELSFSEARLALIRRSALFFADQTPMPFEVHHGTADFVVPVIQSQIFADRMSELGNEKLGFVYWEYPGGGHGGNMDGSFERMQSFMCDFIGN